MAEDSSKSSKALEDFLRYVSETQKRPASNADLKLCIDRALAYTLNGCGPGRFLLETGIDETGEAAGEGGGEEPQSSAVDNTTADNKSYVGEREVTDTIMTTTNEEKVESSSASEYASRKETLECDSDDDASSEPSEYDSVGDDSVVERLQAELDSSEDDEAELEDDGGEREFGFVKVNGRAIAIWEYFGNDCSKNIVVGELAPCHSHGARTKLARNSCIALARDRYTRHLAELK